MEFELVSVNVGLPQVLLEWERKTYVSAIAKHPVTAERVRLDELGIEGDGHADERRIRGVQVHGGPGKAVYAYPSEHFSAWSSELGEPLSAGAFGENLTIRGGTEEEACIGDVWAWGDARLQITEPRAPCYKLNLRRGNEQMIELMNANGRTGWMLRVLKPATVPTRGPISRLEWHPDAVTVLDVHRAWDSKDRDALSSLLDLEPLGADLKQMIRNILRP